MTPNDVPDFVPAELARLGLSLGGPTLERLGNYLRILLRETEKVNLTAVRDWDQAWSRHILDSVSLLPLLERDPPGTRVIDLGSGGGLPGLPLALCRPDLDLTLLEATGKKARFLERCALELGRPEIRVVNQRAEICGRDPDHRGAYQIVLCRAVGALGVIVELGLPLLRIGGRLLAQKGARASEELRQAGPAIERQGGGAPEIVATRVADGVVVIIEKQRPTPERAPKR